MAFNYKTEYERYKRYYQSIEPTLKKQTAKNYTTAIFSFLAVSLFAWYGLRPTISTILFLRREIADDTVVSQQMEAKITHLVEAEATITTANGKLTAIDQAIPQDPHVLELVSTLKNLASVTDSSLSAIQVPSVPLLPSVATLSAGPPGYGKLMAIPLVVEVAGPYTKIKAFLDGVVFMRRIFTIDSIGLNPSKEETAKTASGAGTLLRMVLRLNGYYLPEKKL